MIPQLDDQEKHYTQRNGCDHQSSSCHRRTEHIKIVFIVAAESRFKRDHHRDTGQKQHDLRRRLCQYRPFILPFTPSYRSHHEDKQTQSHDAAYRSCYDRFDSIFIDLFQGSIFHKNSIRQIAGIRILDHIDADGHIVMDDIICQKII